jgi:hypothetical protein
MAGALPNGEFRWLCVNAGKAVVYVVAQRHSLDG